MAFCPRKTSSDGCIRLVWHICIMSRFVNHDFTVPMYITTVMICVCYLTFERFSAIVYVSVVYCTSIPYLL